MRLRPLLKGEMSHPFNIGSEALRDCTANQEHPGTQSEQTLLTLALQQGAAGLEQCDVLRGVAALVRADQVVLAPFPLARTCTVIASKAWYVLTAESREERLRRYLNEELAALYGKPLQSGDEEAVAFVKDRSADYLAVGATAGLTPGTRKIRRRCDTPFLVRRDQARSEAPPSETQLAKSLYRAVLQEDELAGWPYSLLSAATRGRFRQSGFAGYSSTDPEVGGVSAAAMNVTLEVTAQSTMYAAFATRTHLCTLAQYTAVPETVVLARLQEPAAEWLAMTCHGAVP